MAYRKTKPKTLIGGPWHCSKMKIPCQGTSVFSCTIKRHHTNPKIQGLVVTKFHGFYDSNGRWQDVK